MPRMIHTPVDADLAAHYLREAQLAGKGWTWTALGEGGTLRGVSAPASPSHILVTPIQRNQVYVSIVTGNMGRAVTIARKNEVRSAIRTAIELVSPPLVTCREVAPVWNWSQVSIPVYGRIPGIGDVFVTLNGMGDRFRVRYTPHAESVLLDAEFTSIFTSITAGMKAVHRLIDYNRWNNPIAAEHLMQEATATGLFPAWCWAVQPLAITYQDIIHRVYGSGLNAEITMFRRNDGWVLAGYRDGDNNQRFASGCNAATALGHLLDNNHWFNRNTPSIDLR